MIKTNPYNRVKYSEDFTNRNQLNGWSWANFTITPDAAVAPDGTQTADLAVRNTVTTTDGLASHVGWGSTDTVYNASVYAKANGLSHISLIRYVGNTNCQGVSFNLINGTIHDSQKCNWNY